MTDAELCREVAEKVMGIEVIDTWYPNITDMELSWSDAGRVVERMREQGFACNLEMDDDGKWECTFCGGGIEKSAKGGTMPIAMYKAALAAIKGGESA